MPVSNSRSAATAGLRWWLVAAAVVAILAVLYFFWRGGGPQRGAPAPSAPPAAGAAAPTAGEGAGTAQPALLADGPKHPLPGPSPDAAAMPAPERSDAPILEALLALASRDRLAQFLNMQDFARRFVVTVDHLPRESVPAQLGAVRRVPGALAVAPDGDAVTLQPANFARYEPFVRFVESLDPKAMVGIYLRFYPLLQQEYRAMGFPGGHFNDRVVEAIDDMLAAPEVTGPIGLTQPKINYQFVDPLLERLSAGRKIMVRIGPENSGRIRKVLRALRAELVR